MHEIETKVLNVNSDDIATRLHKLGAQIQQDIKLVVDWYGPKGLTHNGDDPWFLRVRSYSEEKIEVTWKGLSDHIGTSRKTKEINFDVSDAEKIGELFAEFGLEKYAHQEKFRKSWILKKWRFDLDLYPKMPPFLEIEGHSEQDIKEAIRLLKLEDNPTFNKGERMLVQDKYGLNWFEMKF